MSLRLSWVAASTLAIAAVTPVRDAWAGESSVAQAAPHAGSALLMHVDVTLPQWPSKSVLEIYWWLREADPRTTAVELECYARGIAGVMPVVQRAAAELKAEASVELAPGLGRWQRARAEAVAGVAAFAAARRLAAAVEEAVRNSLVDAAERAPTVIPNPAALAAVMFEYGRCLSDSTVSRTATPGVMVDVPLEIGTFLRELGTTHPEIAPAIGSARSLVAARLPRWAELRAAHLAGYHKSMLGAASATVAFAEAKLGGAVDDAAALRTLLTGRRHAREANIEVERRIGEESLDLIIAVRDLLPPPYSRDLSRSLLSRLFGASGSDPWDVLALQDRLIRAAATTEGGPTVRAFSEMQQARHRSFLKERIRRLADIEEADAATAEGRAHHAMQVDAWLRQSRALAATWVDNVRAGLPPGDRETFDAVVTAWEQTALLAAQAIRDGEQE